MKFALAALLIVLFAGCAADPEDRAFFNRGWVNPEKGAEERLNKPHGPALNVPDSSSGYDGANSTTF